MSANRVRESRTADFAALEERRVPKSDRCEKAPGSDRRPTRRPPARKFETGHSTKMALEEAPAIPSSDVYSLASPERQRFITNALDPYPMYEYQHLPKLWEWLNRVPVEKLVRDALDFPRMTMAFEAILGAHAWGIDLPIWCMNAVVYGPEDVSAIVSLSRFQIQRVYWRDVEDFKTLFGVSATRDARARRRQDPNRRVRIERQLSSLPEEMQERIEYLPPDKQVNAELAVWNMPPDRLQLRDLSAEVQKGTEIGSEFFGAGLLLMQSSRDAAHYLKQPTGHRCLLQAPLFGSPIMPTHLQSFNMTFQVWQMGPAAMLPARVF